jgi:hypothetical protein
VLPPQDTATPANIDRSEQERMARNSDRGSLRRAPKLAAAVSGSGISAIADTKERNVFILQTSPS